jgi:hypothetical protein
MIQSEDFDVGGSGAAGTYDLDVRVVGNFNFISVAGPR